MKDKLKVLIIDDNPNDRLMVIRELKKEFELISTEIINQHDFDIAMSTIDFDIAITDYQLLWSDGLTLLKEIKKQHPAKPVIMYTGTGNEEVAVESMKNGLDDYIIKSSRQIFRLPHAVTTLIGSVIEKQKRIQAERKYEILIKNLVIGVVQLDLDFNILVANKTQLNFFKKK